MTPISQTVPLTSEAYPGGEVRPAGKYWSNPDLIVFQSRLYSPGYAGPGRWAIVNSRTREAVSAIGPDVIPDSIRILSAASVGKTADELIGLSGHIRARHIDSLLGKDLLLADEPIADKERTFSEFYHALTYDYPFVDYGLPNWEEREEKLMRHYSSLWRAPDSMVNREGDRFPLEDVSLDLENSREKHSELSLGVLSLVLKYTFGPIGTIPTPHVDCIRRTSPSGGARHPTECMVLLRSLIGGIPAGTYWYDVKGHALVAVQDKEMAVHSDVEGSVVSFSIRSRVERAMWRYRDPRAYRPVLLDAGHIIETLAILLGRFGFSIDVEPARPLRVADRDYFLEPEIAVAHVGRDRFRDRRIDSDVLDTQDDSHLKDDLHLTNPCGFMTFEGGGLVFHSMWRKGRRTKLPLEAIRVLSHCLPSNRVDRVTSFEGILEACREVPETVIKRMKKDEVLLPSNIAQEMYSAARFWTRYGWYLSWMFQLEYMRKEKKRVLPVASRIPEDVKSKALLERRTTRKFLSKPVDWEKLSKLFEKRVSPFLSHNSDLRFFFAILQVSGFEPGVYELRSSGMIRLGNVLAREEIQQLTIGQYPASSGAVTCWAVEKVQPRDAKSYVVNILDLGRLGQQLCLGVAEEELGIFMTPAVKDLELLRRLGIEEGEALSSVTYLFSIGIPA